jgi:hypothetical protein
MAQLGAGIAATAGFRAARLAAVFFTEALRLVAGFPADFLVDFLAAFLGDFFADFLADFFADFFFVALFAEAVFTDFFVDFFVDFFAAFFADFLFAATTFFLLFLALTLFAFLDFLAIVVLLLPPINSVLAGGRPSPNREVQSCEQQGLTFHQQSEPCTRYCRRRSCPA